MNIIFQNQIVKGKNNKMDLIKPYYKKTINYKLNDYNLEFMVSQNLFSSQIVDNGTQRLLRTLLFEHIDKFRKALDLGCGYGPIGIVLKKICPESKVHMVDRDALALEYSKVNAELNNVSKDMVVYGSLGYDSVKDYNFDLIVSNIPAKVGNQVLTHMIKDASHYLNKDGIVAIVVIDAISDFTDQVLNSDPLIKILYHRSWSGHHVYHYKFIDKNQNFNHNLNDAFDRGKYKRQENKFTFKKAVYTLETTFNLPEFNKLSFDSNLILLCIQGLNNNVRNALIFNPGQGYIPLAIKQQFNPDKIYLVDRDLLALKISQKNLLTNQYAKIKIRLFHQVGIDINTEKVEMVAGILPEQQNLDVYNLYVMQAYNQLIKNNLFILSSSSTVITRIENIIHKNRISFEIINRERYKGRSSIVLRKIS